MGWKVPPLEMVGRVEPCAGSWAAEEPRAATAIIGAWIHHGGSIGTRSDMAVIKKPESGYENKSQAGFLNTYGGTALLVLLIHYLVKVPWTL